MSEQKKINGAAIGLGVVCIVLAIVLILMAFNYVPTIKGAQKGTQSNTQNTAYLMNVGLGGTDDGNGVFQITGYVVNAGGSTAYTADLHVVAYYVTGTKAIDTYVTIGSGTIDSKGVVQVNTPVSYTYTGSSIVVSTATITPTWNNSP